jgi:hypothetical protein
MHEHYTVPFMSRLIQANGATIAFAEWEIINTESRISIDMIGSVT